MLSDVLAQLSFPSAGAGPLSGAEVASWRRLWPVTRRLAYLQHAGHCALALPVVTAMQSFVEWGRDRPEQELGDDSAPVRLALSELLGCETSELALVRSTAHGISLVAMGLPWRSGDNVVLAEGEYPANVYPWLALKARGVEVRSVSAPDGRVSADVLLAACDQRTRALAVSQVEFANGYRVDLGALRAALPRSVWLAVDGIQAAGALAVDLHALGCDSYCAGGYKWMLASKDSGFLYVRADRLEELSPVLVGAHSVVRREDLFSIDHTYAPDASRLEETWVMGTASYGLGAAARLLVAAGMPRIEHRVLALANRLRAGLEGAHCDPIAPALGPPEERSGIVSFRSRRLGAPEAHTRLLGVGVVINQRSDFLRCSAHFYNTEAEIDSLLEHLEGL